MEDDSRAETVRIASRTLVVDDLEFAPPPVPEASLKLEAELGRGGMGVVWSARQVGLDREVAVKQLLDSASARARKALIREARVTGRLEHPNVVPVHDLHYDDAGSPELVLKRIRGRTLLELHATPDSLPLDAQDDPLGWYLQVLVDVCNALELAHSSGILHRDIKPENVMIGAFGAVYVVDWGVAVGLGKDPSGVIPDGTKTHSVAGTPLYMAPEMFDPDAPLSDRSDVYLLAGLLHFVLTGRPPREPDTLDAMYEASLQVPPLDDSIPSDLQRLLEQSLAVEPGERPSVPEFRVALRKHARIRGALRLLATAERAADQLETLATTPDDPEQTLLSLYDVYGACRFAVAEVLREDPRNRAAKDLQKRTLALMVEHELARDNPMGAATLLEQSGIAPSGLRTRVEEAVAAETARRQRHADLEADLARSTGNWGRMGAVMAIAAVALGAPLTLDVSGVERSAGRMLGQSALNLVVIGASLFAFRRWFLSSRYNRGLATLLLVAPFVEVFAVMNGVLLDVPQAALSGLRASATAMIMVTAFSILDLRLVPAGLQYGVAALLALAYPSFAGPILITSTVVLAAYLLITWQLTVRARSA